MIYQLELSDRKKWTNQANFSSGDAYHVMVVRANGRDHARLVASERAGDEGKEAWLHKSTSVLEIDPDGPEMLLGTF